MKNIKKHNCEVEYNQNDLLTINYKWLKRIKLLAKKNKSNKYRTCIHYSDTDNVHEMLIVATSQTYIRPHKHRYNGESLQFIEGKGTAIIFNEKGKINKSFTVSDPFSNDTFYYSMAKGVYHMLLVQSNFLIFKETTKGPFIRNNTLYPDWAPDGKDIYEIKTYMNSLKKRLNS